jgi:hypothetical protein
MPDFNQQQAFLFMPDISGFTHFVNETDIEHSSHIIQELLEIILDANELGMKLLEIEGDAVFFFRLGKLPTANEIILQAKSIFKKFHQHLLQYESRRICQCGACRTANNLTLKFIIHSGLVGSYFVRNQYKLIGNDIILLHRLLKNGIPLNEYLLFTEPFFKLIDNQNLNQQQLSAVDETGEYDSAIVHYKYVPIKKWLEDIEVSDEESKNIQANLVSVITVSKEINAPADVVFSYIADLSKRVEWMNGIKKIEFISKQKINQAGTVHKCIIDNNSTNVFKSNYFEHGENDFSITELDDKKEAFSQKFNVESLSSKSSKVQMQFLVKNNLIQKLMFSIFKKYKIENTIRKSLDNLEMKFK